MAVLRTLVTRLVLDSRRAFADLKAYGREWVTQAKVVEAAATRIENAATRAGAAMGRVASGAAAVRAGSGGLGGPVGGGAGGRRPSRDPAEELLRAARREAQENDRAQRKADAQRRGLERAGRRNLQSDARQSGLTAGGAAVTEATRALGAFATASDRAKAKVADLSAQVARNRREMADLREQAVRTGDADGTLAGRMQGLAAATQRADVALAGARKELRATEGGFLAAVKKAASLETRVVALGTALGNLGYDLARGGVTKIKDILVGSAEAAMDFEKSIVDVAKVARGTDDTAEGMARIEAGIKSASKELGVMPGQVAELAAAIAPVFSGKEDLVALTSDITKVGVAWDVSGQEAGKFFADVSRGLGTNAEETKDLFGAINELGNQIGVKSSEVAEAMTRSAGVLKGANISGQTGAALNATLIAAGASAEVAATGVRTFVARLGAGEAATDKQIKAFETLGLSAKDVARELTSGDAQRAEKQIKGVVQAISSLRDDQRLPTLIQLFGSESIGSIGAAATAVDTLSKSFEIAGGESARFNSVLGEYDRVSNTSAARVEKLKANIGVLAVELGDKLLPYVDRVVNFLTSPEGQEWGRQAVEKAAAAVTTLADGVAGLVNFFVFLSEKVGGAGVAIAALAPIILSLTGPLGLVAAAGVAMGAAIAAGIDRVVHSAERAQLGLLKLHNQAQAIRAKETDAERAEQVAATDAGLSETERQRLVQAATDRWEQRERAKGGVARGSKEDLAITRRAANMRGELLEGRFSTGSFEDRLKSFEDSLSPQAIATGGDGGGASGGMDRFNDLVARRNRGALRPSEAKELRALSKRLDVAVPKKPGKGHKQTKMDRQLAAMDPALAGLLRQGGEEDAGGDLKVHDDVLSKGAFAAAGRSRGLGGLLSGSGGVGPGPNINTTNVFNAITVNQAIDARGQNQTAAESIASVADRGARMVGGVVFTGVERTLAAKNAGGRMA